MAELMAPASAHTVGDWVAGIVDRKIGRARRLTESCHQYGGGDRHTNIGSTP